MNSSMCQEVTLTNGTKHDYSIGTYDPSNTYKVEGMFLQSPSARVHLEKLMMGLGGGTNSSHPSKKMYPFLQLNMTPWALPVLCPVACEC